MNEKKKFFQFFRRILFGVILTGTILLFWDGMIAAGGKKSDSEVKVATNSTKPDADGKLTISIQLTINKGWHVYANPVDNEDLLPAQTTVKIQSKNKLEKVEIQYPPGQLKEDKLVGNYKIYKDKVTVSAKVKRSAGDQGPLEVSVTFMACHEKGVCLLPATVKLSVP